MPAGGKYVTVGGGWAFVANAKGKNPEAAGEFCAWALASMSPDSIQRVVDWCTVAKSDMPPRNSALEKGKARVPGRDDGGLLATTSIPARAPSRGCRREVYKIVSDAIQAAQLGGQDPAAAAAAASGQLDAFLAGYSGAPIL